MNKSDKSSKPVADIVHSLLQGARTGRTDGPASPLFSARAQLSTTLNQAGTLLAKLDRDVPAPRSSLLQTVLGFSTSSPQPKRRSWFFASKEDVSRLTTRRIEQLLKASAKDGVRLSLETAVAGKVNEPDDLHCVLPEGAADPVCEPRR